MSSLSRGTKEEVFSILPAGTVLPFAGATAPAGWAICDGTVVSRTEYPELFLAIGEAWGNGNGSTTFHLPDLRGRFLRGADNAAGRDPDAGTRAAANLGGNTGDNVGSVQDHQFGSHNHGGGVHNHTIPVRRLSTGSNSVSAGYETTYPTGGSTNNSATIINTEGGAENRPVNANINYIIKL